MGKKVGNKTRKLFGRPKKQRKNPEKCIGKREREREKSIIH